MRSSFKPEAKALQDRAKKSITELIEMHKLLLIGLEARDRGEFRDNERHYHAWSNAVLNAMTVIGDLTKAALASQHAVEGAVAQWQVWVEPDEDEAIVTGWVDEDADMIEHWRSKGRRVRPLYARPAAADAGVREALVNLAHEMRFLLRQNPDKDGGLYRQRLDEADAALALAKGECPHRCDEGGVCLAEHSGFPQSCPRAALSLAAKRGQTNG